MGLFNYPIITREERESRGRGVFCDFCYFEETMKVILRQVKIKHLECDRAGHDG